MAQTAAAHPVRWRGVLVFLLLAFGLAWIPFLPLQANANPAVRVLIVPLQYSPAIAAALVRGPLLPLLVVGAILLGLVLHLATWAPQVARPAACRPWGSVAFPGPPMSSGL